MSSWDSLSSIRRQQIETGFDITFNQIFIPYYRNIVKHAKPKRIVDIGCGTGHLLFHLGDLSQQLVGIEPSGGMYNVARDVLNGLPIDLFQTRIQDFHPGDQFDLAIAHFSLQSDKDVDGFIRGAARILRTNGLFVFTIPHPCFWNTLTHFIPDNEYSYLEPSFAYGKLTVQGQLVGTVPYFHRPLRDYFDRLFRNGFKIAFFDEIHPDSIMGEELVEDWTIPRFVLMQCEKV